MSLPLAWQPASGKAVHGVKFPRAVRRRRGINGIIKRGGLMSVRAKFRVTNRDWVSEDTKKGAKIKMFPVTSGSKENENFYEMTPAGRLELETINEHAAEQLEPNKEYYLDITPAE
jgi:hypothetical protein